MMVTPKTQPDNRAPETNNKNAKIRIHMTQASAAPVFTHITPENTKQCVFEVYYYCYESVSVLLSTV